MITKKDFQELVKIHAKSLLALNDGEPIVAHGILEFGLRDFYKKIIPNYCDSHFLEFKERLAKKLKLKKNK